MRVRNVDAYVELPPFPLQLPGWTEPWYLSGIYVPLGLGLVDIPKHQDGLFTELNQGTFDARSGQYSTTMGLALFLPNEREGARNTVPAVLRSVGSISGHGQFFSAGIGTILAGAFAGAMFCCGHGKPAPPPGPGDNIAPPTSASVGTPGSFPRRPAPPKLKKNDVIDGKWLVADLSCETHAETDCRTVGYTQTKVTCSGCGNECMVLSCPMDPPTEKDNTWTLVEGSKGGGTFKTFDGKPRSYYTCACLID